MDWLSLPSGVWAALRRVVALLWRARTRVLYGASHAAVKWWVLKQLPGSARAT